MGRGYRGRLEGIPTIEPGLLYDTDHGRGDPGDTARGHTPCSSLHPDSIVSTFQAYSLCEIRRGYLLHEADEGNVLKALGGREALTYGGILDQVLRRHSPERGQEEGDLPQVPLYGPSGYRLVCRSVKRDPVLNVEAAHQSFLGDSHQTKRCISGVFLT
jgi:hypothetical protein